MSQHINKLEKTLDEVFGKKAPWQLPENAKKTIVQYLPIINLILGVITLLAAWSLWRWANQAAVLVEWANDLARTYGGQEVSTSRLSAMVWISLVILAIQGVLYIAAYPGTKAKQKSGWNLLFYAALINIVYGVAVLFTDYGGGTRLLSSLVGSAIGFYFLFQIRPYYVGKKSADTTEK